MLSSRILDTVTISFLYVTPKDAPGKPRRWVDVMEYAANLDAHGHEDWSIPTEEELKAIFKNRARIGNFNEGPRSADKPAYCYASSSNVPTGGGWYDDDLDKDKVLALCFRTAGIHKIDKEKDLVRVRPVRVQRHSFDINI